MFNSFPQPKPDSGGGAPWIGDWSAYQTVFDWSLTGLSIPSSSWSTFLNATGSGWLTFVNASTVNYNPTGLPDVKVTIDGTPYLFSGTTATNSAGSGNLISQPIYFKNSLKIEVYNRDAAAQNYFCSYTYLLKNTTPKPNNQTILLSSSRNMAANSNATTSAVDIVNITGSGYLLAVEFSGYATTIDGATIKGTVAIDGAIKMASANVFNPSNAAYKNHYFAGPIRFTTSMSVSHFPSTTNTTAYSRAWYSLD